MAAGLFFLKMSSFPIFKTYFLRHNLILQLTQAWNLVSLFPLPTKCWNCSMFSIPRKISKSVFLQGWSLFPFYQFCLKKNLTVAFCVSVYELFGVYIPFYRILGCTLISLFTMYDYGHITLILYLNMYLTIPSITTKVHHVLHVNYEACRC